MISLDRVGIGLRKFEPRDIPALYAFRNDREVTSGLGGFSTGYTVSDLERWIDHHNSRADEVMYAIVDSDDEVLGHVGLYRVDSRVRKAGFGILIGRTESQGRGVGRAVSQWMIDFGFQELNLNKISLSVLSSNERAFHLYKSLGFVEEGVQRQDQYRNGVYLDVVMMSILRSEWEAEN